eukprot:2540884-Prymnesium_polylepis.1
MAQAAAEAAAEAEGKAEAEAKVAAEAKAAAEAKVEAEAKAKAAAEAAAEAKAAAEQGEEEVAEAPLSGRFVRHERGGGRGGRAGGRGGRGRGGRAEAQPVDFEPCSPDEHQQPATAMPPTAAALGLPSPVDE